METFCWLWAGAVNSKDYGRVQSDGRRLSAHRVVYESIVEEIPDNLDLDHLCRTPRCVNPEHLEPVTHRENTLRGVGACAKNHRKTHCPQGHPYTGDNVRFIQPGNGRRCRTCNRDFVRKYRQQAKARRKLI